MTPESVGRAVGREPLRDLQRLIDGPPFSVQLETGTKALDERAREFERAGRRAIVDA